MHLEDIQRMWEKDSVIDEVLLDEEALKIPQLHAKYISIYNDFKLLLIKAQQELKNVKHQRWLFYTGKHVPEDSEPFDYKVTRGEAPNWVAVDEKVLKVEAKIEYYETTLHNLSEILRQINNRNFMIKNAIEWRRFSQGG